MVILCIGLLSSACVPIKPLVESEPAAPAPLIDPFPSVQFGHTLTRIFTGSGLPAVDGTTVIQTPLARRLTISYTAEQFAAFGAKVPLFAKIDLAAVRTAEIIFLDVSRIKPITPPTTGGPVSELVAGRIYLQLYGPEGDLFQHTDYLDAGFPDTYHFDGYRTRLLIGRDLVFGTK